MSWRAAADPMVPAELATWVMGGGWPAAVRAVTTRVEPLELQDGEGAVVGAVPVGHGQVGPEGTEAEVGIGGDGRGQGRGLGGVDAHPVHPGVHLQVHRHRGQPESATARLRAAIPPAV